MLSVWFGVVKTPVFIVPDVDSVFIAKRPIAGSATMIAVGIVTELRARFGAEVAPGIAPQPVADDGTAAAGQFYDVAGHIEVRLVLEVTDFLQAAKVANNSGSGGAILRWTALHLAAERTGLGMFCELH